MEYTSSFRNPADKRVGLFQIAVYFCILILLFCQISAVSVAASEDDWSYLGQSYYEEGKYGDAVTAFLNAVATDSESAELWNYLGLSYMAEREYSGAMSAFKRAVALNPQYIEAWNNLGATYKLLDRSDDARLAYLMAQALDADTTFSGVQFPSYQAREQPPTGFYQGAPAPEPQGPWVPGFSLLTN